MSEAEPLNTDDLALLAVASNARSGLSSEHREQLAALADRLAPAIDLPGAERGAALQHVLLRADVELLQAAARSSASSDASASPPGAVPAEPARDGAGERLEALARKLTAYLPPKNGG